MDRVIVVTGLQWGSEAKGNIAAAVALSHPVDTTVSAWHPNAGHTAVIRGKKYVHCMLPIAALAPNVRKVLLGPGSVIDLAKLRDEIEQAGELMQNKSIIIHPNATIWTPEFADREKELVKIGSTMKGSAQAVIAKMMRGLYGDVIARDQKDRIRQMLPASQHHTVTYGDYFDALATSKCLMVEGAQGYGLGINTMFYPYTTSRDVTLFQIFADCRLPPRATNHLTTIGVIRTYPIRVANRFNEAGEQVGTSGPCYEDQRELDWQKDLGMEPELTTVTKLPRRIFTFSKMQLLEAQHAVAPTVLALTFADYLSKTETHINDYIDHTIGARIAKYDTDGNEFLPYGVGLVAYGPDVTDVMRVVHSGDATTAIPLVAA